MTSPSLSIGNYTISLLYILDKTSDAFVIITSWMNGPVWLTGFIIFLLSIALRMLNECDYYRGAEPQLRGVQRSLDSLIATPFVWIVIFLFKVIRVVFVPFDIFLSIGYYMGTGNYDTFFFDGFIS